MITSKTAMWFICGIRYERTMEDGTQKKVSEKYLIDALSFEEAEVRIIELMSSYISGEYAVKELSIAPWSEVFFSDEPNDDKWYKAKLQFITIDESSGKEKKSTVLYLVQASSLKDSVNKIEEFMSGTMINYSIVALQETSLRDVFIYKTKEEEQE